MTEKDGGKIKLHATQEAQLLFANWHNVESLHFWNIKWNKLYRYPQEELHLKHLNYIPEKYAIKTESGIITMKVELWNRKVWQEKKMTWQPNCLG